MSLSCLVWKVGRPSFSAVYLLTPGEWALHLEVFFFEELHRRWGILDVDLLASRFNAKRNRFVFETKDT